MGKESSKMEAAKMRGEKKRGLKERKGEDASKNNSKHSIGKISRSFQMPLIGCHSCSSNVELG